MNVNVPSDIKKIINLINDMNINSYLVGGAVRDSIIGYNPVDYDFTAELNEDEHLEVSKKMALELNCKLEYNQYYHTAKFLIDNMSIDFVMSRDESYSGYAVKPIVKSSYLYNDLKRRDFTINSIAVSVKDNKLYDPYNGVDDIKQKKIRILHDKSFKDDPTRILRSIKYSARLGFDFENNTENLIKDAINQNLLNLLNNNILKNELDGVFLENNYKMWVELFKKYDILSIMYGIEVSINDNFDYDIFKKLKFTDKLTVLLFDNNIETNQIISDKMQLNKQYIRNIILLKDIKNSIEINDEKFSDILFKFKNKIKLDIIKSAFRNF